MKAPSTADPVTLRIEEPGAYDSGHCLTVTNTVSGGTFGTTVIPGQFDLQDLPRMSFDYRLPADGSAKVNFYLTLAGRLYEVIFAGPSHGSGRAGQIGVIPDVKADGEWHHAEFDLLSAVERHAMYGGSTTGRAGPARAVRAREFWIGNLCDDDYLLAGFGGNYLGTTYHLDNFVLDRPGGREIKLAFAPSEGAKVTGYSVSADADPNAEPGQTVATTGPSLDLSADGGGIWYVHARAQLEDGQWSRTVRHRIR